MNVRHEIKQQALKRSLIKAECTIYKDGLFVYKAPHAPKYDKYSRRARRRDKRRLKRTRWKFAAQPIITNDDWVDRLRIVPDKENE